MLAWGIHTLTASGVVFALLALMALRRGDPSAALLWLFAALLIDGVDGTLARAAQVRERLPKVDGEALDLVVDYLTYVFLPALIIWSGDYLPDGYATLMAAAILMSSLYTFARRDMKTEDGYFRGFPALWNVVALYFVVGDPSPGIAAAVVAALIILTFAPVHVVHPFRVRDYGWLLPVLAILWGAVTAAMLVPDPGSAIRDVLLAISLVLAALLVALGLVRTVRGPRSGAQ